MSGLEVCANSYLSALAAQQGGAIRVELCENMAEGGTTPSYAQIKRSVEQLSIAIWPILRPRGGDFLYSKDEFELIKEDLLNCKRLNCAGAVTGILLANGEIDIDRCATLIELAYPMPLAFHRAFDMCSAKEKALEQLVKLGFVRILTSGGAANALSGATTIASLVKQAGSRIEIMPGAGINPDNILDIKAKTGAITFHASARVKIASQMQYRNPLSKMGTAGEEFEYWQSSASLIKAMVEKLKTG